MEYIYLEQKSYIIFKQYTFIYMVVLNVKGRQISVKVVRSVGILCHKNGEGDFSVYEYDRVNDR